mgnify:CR=1 FL=1
MCKVEGCERISMYKADDVCQKHYFRYMRNGTYSKVKKRAEQLAHSNGYILTHDPDHPLAQESGYIYEHRKVAYEKYGVSLPDCELCDVACDWELYTTHIDHKDKDKSNNSPENLRPLCNSCNIGRTIKSYDSDNYYLLTHNGETKTATAWARSDGVDVSRGTIVNRKRKGMTDYDCLFLAKKTHNKSTKRD